MTEYNDYNRVGMLHYNCSANSLDCLPFGRIYACSISIAIVTHFDQNNFYSSL